jgi:hypothetical protein
VITRRPADSVATNSGADGPCAPHRTSSSGSRSRRRCALIVAEAAILIHVPGSQAHLAPERSAPNSRILSSSPGRVDHCISHGDMMFT